MAYESGANIIAKRNNQNLFTFSLIEEINKGPFKNVVDGYRIAEAIRLLSIPVSLYVRAPKAAKKNTTNTHAREKIYFLYCLCLKTTHEIRRINVGKASRMMSCKSLVIYFFVA